MPPLESMGDSSEYSIEDVDVVVERSARKFGENIAESLGEHTNYEDARREIQSRVSRTYRDEAWNAFHAYRRSQGWPELSIPVQRDLIQ